MKITVNDKLCIGCGLCSELASEIFEMSEGKTGMVSVVKKNNELSEKDADRKAKDAQNSCPVGAIDLTTS